MAPERAIKWLSMVLVKLGFFMCRTPPPSASDSSSSEEVRIKRAMVHVRLLPLALVMDLEGRSVPLAPV